MLVANLNDHFQKCIKFEDKGDYESIKWLSSSAALGCYKAKYCLGIHYIDRKDKHRAAHWIKAAAKNSNNKYKKSAQEDWELEELGRVLPDPSPSY